jgi:hypothetical protein
MAHVSESGGSKYGGKIPEMTAALVEGFLQEGDDRQ